MLLWGSKMSPKPATKPGIKFATKLGTKASAGFIPFVGPAARAGINA